MVDRKYINPGTPVAGPYTPAVIAGNLIFVSGQVPSPDSIGIRDQTTSVLNKIKALLESCDSSIDNIVKTTVFLKNLHDFNEMNEVYETFFREHGIDGDFPARSTVQASPPVEGVLLEMDIIATR